MQKPTPKASHTDGLTRRNLLRAGGALFALNALGGSPTFAAPIRTGDANEDSKRSVAQVRFEMHKRPTSVEKLSPVLTNINIDPGKVVIPKNDEEYYAKVSAVLAYAADLKGHESEYGGRENGIVGIRNFALGISEPNFDPTGEKFQRGMATLGYEYKPSASDGGFIITPEMQMAYDMGSKAVTIGAGATTGPLGSAILGIATDFGNNPEKYGRGYGAPIKRDSLMHGLASDVTRRAYSLEQQFKKGELDVLGTMFGVDLAADLKEHLANVPLAVQEYVGDAINAHAAGDISNKELADKIVEQVSEQYAKGLKKLKTAVTAEMQAQSKANAAAADEAAAARAAAEKAKIEKQRLQNEIQGGAYLASWLAQSFLDEDVAKEISKLANAGVAISSMVAQGSALGPIGWTAGSLSIMNSLMSSGPSFQEQVGKMLDHLNESIKDFRAENRKLHMITHKALGRIEGQQYKILERLEYIIDSYKKGNTKVLKELETLNELAKFGIKRNTATERNTVEKPYRDARETFRSNEKIRDARSLRTAMQDLYDYGMNAESPPLTGSDVNAGEHTSLQTTLDNITHVAQAVAIIPSAYNAAKPAIIPSLNPMVNPEAAANALTMFADAMIRFPEIESTSTAMDERANEMRGKLAETVAGLVKATDSGNVKALAGNYLERAQSLWDRYIEKAYADYIEDLGRDYLKDNPVRIGIYRSNALTPEIYTETEAFKLAVADDTHAIETSALGCPRSSANGWFCDTEADYNEGKKYFKPNCGQDILELAARYGLISITKIKEEDPVTRTIDAEEAEGQHPNKPSRRVLTDTVTRYAIRFEDSDPNDDPIYINAHHFSSTYKRWRSYGTASVLEAEETDPLSTVFVLDDKSKETKLSYTKREYKDFFVGNPDDKVTYRAYETRSYKDKPIANTSGFLEALCSRLVVHHDKLRDDFLKKLKSDCVGSDVSTLAEGAFSEEVKSLRATGLTLQYLAAVRYWLDTGDAKGAALVATRNSSQQDEYKQKAIPVFPNDIPTLNFAAGSKAPIFYKTFLKSETDRLIPSNFLTAFDDCFPEAKERVVNIPEITMAELTLSGALDTVKKKEKSEEHGGNTGVIVGGAAVAAAAAAAATYAARRRKNQQDPPSQERSL